MNITIGELLKEQKEDLELELIAGEKSLGRKILGPDLNRPGLALNGCLDHFRPERIQIIGNGEQCFCMKAPQKPLQRSLDAMLSFPALPCLILTHNLQAPPVLVQACRKKGVPLLRSRLDTAVLVGGLSAFLENRLSPKTVVHGVLVEVYGLGVLIQGEAGIGKSECALELLKRGHILVADDAIEVQHRRGGGLLGICPEPLRHYIEVRGLGIIDVKLLFGVGAILDHAPVELAVHLEPWAAQGKYDRSGLETRSTMIVGVRIPEIKIAVSPGRNLAILIEVAALNQRLRGQGYFSAETFNRKLIERMRSAPGGKKPAP